MFLGSLGYKSLFNPINENFVELVIWGQNEFLDSVKKETESTGFCPYHLAISEGGERFDARFEDKVEFNARVVAILEFENVSAPFRLIVFEGDYIWLWKYYGTREFSLGDLRVTAQYVAPLKGKNGIINLVKNVRMYDR